MRKRGGESSLDICIEKVSSLLFDVVVKGGLTEDEILVDWFGEEPHGLRGNDEAEKWVTFIEECLANVDDLYFEEQRVLYEEINGILAQ